MTKVIKSVIYTDPITGKQTIYPDIRTAAKAKNIQEVSIKRHLQVKGKTWSVSELTPHEMELTKVKDVGKRLRIDSKDIESLKESIEKIGLLQPVTVDQNGTLIAGGRRLEACKQLNHSLRVEIVNVESPSHKLALEIAENIENEPFTPSEAHSIYKKHKDLYNSYKHEAKLKGDNSVRNPNAKPIELAAKTAGLSVDTLSKINQVMISDNTDVIQKLNTGKMSVNAAYNKVKEAKETESKSETQPNLKRLVLDRIEEAAQRELDITFSPDQNEFKVNGKAIPFKFGHLIVEEGYSYDRVEIVNGEPLMHYKY
tara:strand:+ start:2914 stop:3852 length:939 start_codon:yes stop_codon:yes gene_type:complete